MSLRFLVRVKGTKPKAEFLSEVRSLSKSLGLDPRNAKWTSYGALEMDFFAPSKEDFHLFLAALEPLAKIEFSRDDLNDAPTHLSKQDTIDQAVDYFNRERFWESHEVFESLWRTLSGEEKSYIQGIILVCAAFVHEQKGERKVAMGIFRRARRQLDYSKADYQEISVSNLANKVDEILATENPKVFRI